MKLLTNIMDDLIIFLFDEETRDKSERFPIFSFIFFFFIKQENRRVGVTFDSSTADCVAYIPWLSRRHHLQQVYTHKSLETRM